VRSSDVRPGQLLVSRRSLTASDPKLWAGVNFDSAPEFICLVSPFDLVLVVSPGHGVDGDFAFAVVNGLIGYVCTLSFKETA